MTLRKTLAHSKHSITPQAEEHRLREEHVRFQDLQSRLHQERKDEVVKKKEEAMLEVRDKAQRKREELARKEVSTISRDMMCFLVIFMR